MAKITDSAIEDCRKRFEAGDAKALLDAVDFCARSATAMPLWIVEAFCARYAEWSRYEVKTLDQAFRVVRKGERIPNRKVREWLKPRVAMEANRLHIQEKLPIDEALFERVGQILGIPTGTARDIYYKDNPWRQLFEANSDWLAPRSRI
jgi:hypothetical protein